MKIAIWHNLPSGGGKRALHDQVAGLKNRGHEIEAWCPPTAQTDYLPLAELGIVEHVVPLATGGIASMARRISDGFASSVWCSTPNEDRIIDAIEEHSRQVAAEIQNGRFDLLLAHPCQFFAAPAIGRHLTIPRVLYLQEPLRAFYEARPQLPWLADEASTFAKRVKQANWLRAMRVHARQERANAEVYDLLLVNSLFSRESLLRAYGLDSRVCRLGVDAQRFSDLGLPREAMVIGVGSIHPHKNVKLILQSLAAMSLPRPKLIWVGNAAHPAYLDELIEMARLGNVDFQPMVMISDRELRVLLNRATVMAYAPSLEPFGYAPLEANACGTPVVAVAEGGVRETIVDGRNGLLVEHDPQAIAAALTRLFDDPTQARRLGQGGRAWVEERFSLSAATDYLEQKLHSIFPRKRK